MADPFPTSFPELPGRVFSIREVSACVYQVTGTHPDGPRVQATDTDPERLLADARRDAARLAEDMATKLGQR